MEYEFHPLANIFPLMTDEETEALGNDMLEHAQQDPIWLYEGKILDGRNRYNACIIKGIELRFAEFRGHDPLAFVVSANLYRRQLNAGQRALVFETLANLPHGGDRRSEQAAKIAACSQVAVAKLGKVSPRTISTAKALKRDAIPAVVDAVKRGEVPIAQAAEFAKQEPPLDQQRLIAEHGSPADAVKATVKAKADRAAHKTPKPKPDVAPAADRAERTPAAKAAASSLIAPKFISEFTRTDGQVKAACDYNPEDPGDVAESDNDTPEMIRHRIFMYRATEAARHAREFGLEKASSEEFTDDVIEAALKAAEAWSALTSVLRQRADRRPGRESSS
jgi:hypothetical protein